MYALWIEVEEEDKCGVFGYSFSIFRSSGCLCP